jgi:hypothetical protein
LAAIGDYAQARAAVASNQQGVTSATATLQSAVAVQSQARAAQQRAQGNANQATVRMRGLAVAAYMGLGYITPAAGPQSVQDSETGTVSTPGGLTGTAAVDAEEMLRLVAQRERKDLADTRTSLHQAQGAAKAAGQGVAQAQSTVQSAETALANSQQSLALVTKAAITPGLAAGLNLPNLGGSPSSLPPAAGPASGLSALAAPSSRLASPTTTTVAGSGPEDGPPSDPLASPTVLGSSVLSAPELAAWFASTHRKANVSVPIPQLAADYALAGQQTGVRADLAFAQSVVETGFFSFPAGGQLTPPDNNFAGIGACDSCAHGWKFPNALIGVTAQMQLLDAYASPEPVQTNLIGNVGIGGCCPTWMALAGTWASSLIYGISIMTVYHQMLNWAITQRLVAAGLLPPPKAPAAKVVPAPAGAGAAAQPGSKAVSSAAGKVAPAPAHG